MKLFFLSLSISTLLALSACSDSNSVDELDGENSTVDSGSEANTNTDESTNGAEQSSNTDEGNTTQSDTETAGPEETPSELAPSFADYRITFEATWSAESHPTQFPASAHFSGLVGAVHNDQVTFWEPGQIATDGIELMAETGGKSIFLSEINSAIDSGYALSAIDGPGISVSPGSASIEIRVTTDNPKVTLATMLAPSPDWFTGFHNIRFYEDGAFVDNLTINGFVYDSGTDSGVSFTSGNSDTQPRGTIIRTSSEPTDSPFEQGLPSVGRFIIERL